MIPASPILAEVERSMSGKMGRELVLRKALKDVRKEHDLVLIDCPPALGLLTINGLVAADWALVSSEAQYFALQGVEGALEVVEQAKEFYNPDLEFLGVALNIADMRTVHSREAFEQLKEHYGEKVFESVIRSSIAYAETAEKGVSILDHRPDLGADYLALADEVLGASGSRTRARSSSRCWPPRPSLLPAHPAATRLSPGSSSPAAVRYGRRGLLAGARGAPRTAARAATARIAGQRPGERGWSASTSRSNEAARSGTARSPARDARSSPASRQERSSARGPRARTARAPRAAAPAARAGADTASKTRPSHGLRSRGPQTAIAARPPGRSTRRISRAARAGSTANISPSRHSTTSKRAVRLVDLLEVEHARADVRQPGCAALAAAIAVISGATSESTTSPPGADPAARPPAPARRGRTPARARDRPAPAPPARASAP